MDGSYVKDMSELSDFLATYTALDDSRHGPRRVCGENQCTSGCTF